MDSKISKTVLVTGANGYIGRAVAVAFRSQGFTVYGVVRSEEKALESRLMQEEIIPVIGDPNKPEEFQEYINKAGIICENASSTDKPDLIQNLIQAVVKSGKCEDNSKKLYIQTTGFMQYAHEPLVLQNKNIVGCVVRPAFVYGGNGGPAQRMIFFNKPESGVIKTGAKGSNVWPWVQLYDLAKAYTLIAANKQKVEGQIFKVGYLNKNITYEKVLEASAKVMGVKIQKIAQPEGFEAFVNISIEEYDNKSTQIVLNWQPCFACNPLEDIELQYKCYLSWLGKN